MESIPERILKQRIISKRYYERNKEAKKQKYQENKDELKLKALEYYKNTILMKILNRKEKNT